MEAVYTSISQALLRRAIFRGAAIAFFGIALLWGAFLCLPAPSWDVFGSISVLVGLTTINYGFLPYGQLRRLACHPDRLEVDEEGINLVQKNKAPLWLPWKAIRSIAFVQRRGGYGIALGLEPGASPIFLPFFTERTCRRLVTCREDATMPSGTDVPEGRAGGGSHKKLLA